jgi:hypothetical protein
MWQWLVVAPVVVASAAYAAWKLMPGQTRLRLARWLSRQSSRGPASLARLGRRLEQAAAPAGGCDACPATRLDPPASGSKVRPPR